MLYALDPAVTSADDAHAAAFLDAAHQRLTLAPVTSVPSADAALACEPGDGDGIVFANPTAPTTINAEVEAFLERARDAGALILPVAITPDARTPPAVVADAQSFDVHERLRRRSLQPDQVAVAADEFARDALSRLQPTCIRQRLRVFLSYRRADAEDLCAALDAAISSRHDYVFRDLIDVDVGEEAQATIEEALALADVIILLDTPKAGESPWIAREIELALGRSVPIVWLRLGDEDRAPLPVPPAAAPNIERPLELTTDDITALAADALDTAFRLATEHVRAARSAFERIRAWARNRGAELTVLDQRQMIYELRHPPAEGPYPLRPAVDVLQVFGRQVDQNDREQLEKWLVSHDMGPHARDCRAFDAALLLCPLPAASFSAGDWSVLEHPSRYLEHLAGPDTITAEHGPRPTLLLLGAFPTESDSHAEVVAAVRTVAAGWLRHGGQIVFGGHPTFTPLVLETAQLLLGRAPGTLVHIFQTALLASEDDAARLAERCAVTRTDAMDGRAASLTEMRRQMIDAVDEPAVTIAIGGRTSEGGTHVPGIDEELALATERRLPIVLLGAPGGRAAELAADRAAEQSWDQLGNRLSANVNLELFSSSDYERAVDEVWRAHIAQP
jgi:hypothetical protein